MARTPGSGEYNYKKRAKAIHIVLTEGRTQSEAAKELKVHLRTVQRWIELFRKHGLKGILSKKASGRPRKLTDKQIKILGKILLSGPKAQGYSNNLWTSRRVLKLIKDIAGVEYHFNHVPRLLRQMGWSPQRPQRQAIEKDRKQIDEWVKVTWKNIKKKRAGRKPPSSS